MKNALTTTYSGLGNAHRLMLLEEGLKLENVGIPPNDSQFLESRQFQIPEVARWFNLPPHKLKDLTKSSFSNIEQEQISFVVDSILPWLVRLEQNFNNQLLTDNDKNLSGYGRLYFKHIVEGLLRGDAASRATFYKEMFMVGAMSVNEIREKEDMDPIKGGDIHLVPLNMTSLENAGKPPEQKLLPAPEQIPKKGNGESKEVAAFQ
jgi:HK97 family phage portal protein